MSCSRAVLSDKGFALIAVMMMIVVLLALVGSYAAISRMELATNRFAAASARGFYAAEAGLNVRADQIRTIFVGYNRPSGSSPDADAPCEGENLGSGHFACETYDVSNRQAVTYISEDAGNPQVMTIPVGERYQKLNAQEYRYSAISKSLGPDGGVEAILELRFKTRLVPLFQFAAFFENDLELIPGRPMTLAGPIHTNHNLFLNAYTGNTVSIGGQITVAENFYRGRKDTNNCYNNTVTVKNRSNVYTQLIPNCPTRVMVTDEQVSAWQGLIEMGVPVVDIPQPEDFAPLPGKPYWEKADLRLVLMLDANDLPIVTVQSPTGVVVKDADGTTNEQRTTDLHDVANCPGLIAGRAVGATSTFWNVRENDFIHMMEVDMRALLNCIHRKGLFGTSVLPSSIDCNVGGQKRLDDCGEGGIVLHLSVFGAHSEDQQSDYGVRLRNGGTLQASVAGAPTVRGITVVTNQALYSMKHYNNSGKIPAAFLCDSYNVLSEAWPSPDYASNVTRENRNPNATTVNAAVLAGHPITGGVNGEDGFDQAYSGGLENFPRFHEDWADGSKVFTYAGSLVSLSTSAHSNGAWCNPACVQYSAPNRNWTYDTMFNDAAKLPPMTPRFVYLKQQLFLRDYEQD